VTRCSPSRRLLDTWSGHAASVFIRPVLLPLTVAAITAAATFVPATSAPATSAPATTVVPVTAAATTAAPVTAAASAAPATTTAGPAAVRHVFVINLENKGFATTFGPSSPATYLNHTLRPAGALLTQYYGVAHNSLPNYLAQISGQAPNPQTQADCQVYSDFIAAGPVVAPQQVVGNGCVYPATVKTLPDQLTAKGLAWKGYLQDMALGGRKGTCEHPALGTRDTTQKATATDQYAARHNPFVYFHSIIDSPGCARNDVDLTALPHDLSSVATTANVTFITPNLCNDGHDAPCADGRPGGLVSIDAWLKTWVPKIQASPAYKKDGLIVITFDESDSPQTDSTACCGQTAGPNSPMPGITGPGGGRVGAVLLSRWIRPGTTTPTPYNHYGLLASIESLFGLSRLGYASTVPHTFGRDVYTAP